MKKFPMIALLLAPYALGALIAAAANGSADLRIGAAAYLLVLVLNMGYAFVLPRKGADGERLLFWCMLLKLCHVPVYLAVFAAVLLTNVLGIALIPILFAFDYLLLLSSSAYGISGLLALYRSKKLSLRALIVNVAAQLVFCADVFGAVYCCAKSRRAPNL